MIRLGLLDQSIIYENENAISTLAKTVDYAQQADILGFDAFYVSEHHLIDQMAGVSPEVLMGYLLAATDQIKIGSAGVMLQHFVPYKVAENFGVLANLAPHRVIAGIGKAQGGNDQVVTVLQKDAFLKPISFEEKYREVVGLLHQTLPVDHRYFDRIKLAPALSAAPEMVLLGGSLESAALANETQSSMIYPFFANGNETILSEVKQAFSVRKHTRFMVAVTVALVDSLEQKQTYLDQLASYTVHFESGKRLNFADETSAKTYQETQEEKTWIEKKPTGAIVAQKETLAKELKDFCVRHDLSDIVIHTPYMPYEEKMQLIEYLATKFELKRGALV